MKVQSLGLEGPLEEGIAAHPVFFPGESHGWRNLVDYSPWGRKESDMMEMSSVQFSSVSQLCLTLCNPMNYSTPSLPVHYQLLDLIQTHAH